MIRTLVGLCAVALVVGGGVALSASDSDGYVDLGTKPGLYQTTGYALTTDGWDAKTAMLGALGTVRLRVTPADGEKPVLVGIARSADVDRYLSGVQYTTVHDGRGGGAPTVSLHAGGAPAAAPGRAPSWVAHASGAGPQTVVWPVRAGNYRLVVMNADGTPRVGGRVSVSATVPFLPWIGVGLLVCGLLLASLVAVLTVRSVRRRRDPSSGRRT